MNNKRENLVKITTAAMLAAFTCVATMIIRIPTVGTNGYVNIGDSIVLISAWLLGNPYGALAAGIGSAMADLLAGYGSYVPGTFAIKFLMAFVAAIVTNKFTQKKLNNIVSYVLSAVVAEFIMVAGYFLYESTILGYGLGAVPSIASNCVQGITCAVLGVFLIQALNGSKYIVRMVSNKQ